MSETFWNGEPAVAVRGTGVVQPSPTVPQFWGRHLIGRRVRVVRVTYGGHITYLYNDLGQGWHKVTKGYGSPRLAHANLSVADFEEYAG